MSDKGKASLPPRPVQVEASGQACVLPFSLGPVGWGPRWKLDVGRWFYEQRDWGLSS